MTIKELRDEYDRLAAEAPKTAPNTNERAKVMEEKRLAFIAWREAVDKGEAAPKPAAKSPIPPVRSAPRPVVVAPAVPQQPAAVPVVPKAEPPK